MLENIDSRKLRWVLQCGIEILDRVLLCGGVNTLLLRRKLEEQCEFKWPLTEENLLGAHILPRV